MYIKWSYYIQLNFVPQRKWQESCKKRDLEKVLILLLILWEYLEIE